jgi:sulfonate transport system permease protein
MWRTPGIRQAIRLPFVIRPFASFRGSSNSWTGPALGIVSILAMWQILGSVIPWARYTLSTPGAIAIRAWHDLPLYPDNVLATLGEALQGFAWGNLAALMLAFLVAQVTWADRTVMQVAVIIHAMPLLAIAPILAVVLPGDQPKVALAALAVFFPSLIASVIGLRSTDTSLLALIHAFGGRSRHVLWKVKAPASLPWVLAGLRVAAPSATLGAILGEFLGGDRGIGVAMVNAMASLDTPRVWGLAIAASGLASAGFAVLAGISRMLVTWTPPLSVSSWSSTNRPSTVGQRFARGIGETALTLLILVGCWWSLLAVFRPSPFFAKSPADVLSAVLSGPQALLNRHRLSQALTITLVDAVSGFFAGISVAIAAAVVFTLFPILARVFMPLAIGLRTVPVIAMTPLLVLLFGRGLLGTAIITTIITFFPTFATVLQGLRAASQEAIDLLRVYGASDWLVMLKVRLPSAIPSLFASARLSILSSILGAIVAEWLSTGRGLGSLMVTARAEFQFTLLWAAGALVTLVSATFYGVLSGLEGYYLQRFYANNSR